MFTLLNPTKTADLLGYVVTSKPCPTCDESISIEIAPEKLFLYNQGGYAQDVLSNFDVDVRERFITGNCGECWNAMFGSDDEGDLDYLIDSYAEASLFGWDS
jgi:hypothetical protein